MSYLYPVSFLVNSLLSGREKVCTLLLKIFGGKWIWKVFDKEKVEVEGKIKKKLETRVEEKETKLR